MSQSSNKKIKRRKFLKYSGVGVGLMIGGVWLARNPLRRKVFELSETLIPPYQGNASNPLIWLQVTPDNKIILHSSKVEMGQGSFTSLAQLAAEELEVDINRIQVVHAETKTGNIDGFGTGGSMSIATLWQPLREMAATMREMIKTKAAEKLGVASDMLKITDGVISGSGKSLSYGELVDGIQDWDIPKTPALKKRSEYKYIGKPIARVDLYDKVVGTPIFGIDASYPDMLFASVVRPRLIDSEMSDFDIAEAEKMPGVVKVMQDEHFIGVVAHSQVEANNARLKIRFNYTKNQNWNISDVNEMITVGNGRKTVFQKNGKPVEDIDADGEIFSIEFRSPIGAHAQIEPNGAVAKYENGKVDIKLSTQVAKLTRTEVAKAMGLDKDNVNIITTYLGGGFGGRLHTPHAIYAAKMSKEVGRPVKLVFDRQQEFQNDNFRPPTHHVMKAKIADDGKSILGLEHQIASGDTLFNSALDPGVQTVIRADIGSIRGGALIYDALPHRSTYYHIDIPFATSFWRSLGLLANAFAIESFMDELAIKTDQDPVQLRLSSISDNNPYGLRAKKVIEVCAQKAGYTDKVTDGKAMGFAATIDGGSPCAHIAEVSIDDGEIRVHKVTAAFDCGMAVNPDQVKAQVEGCICMGISAALYEKMDLRDNKLYPINYGSYKMALMRNTPKEIDVILIEGAEIPGPVGEPPMGPIGAAIGNAIRRLTGNRITEMPIQDFI